MGAPSPDRPPFQLQEVFIENAFERRFQGLVCGARRERSSHIISALPGSGKSWGIGEMVKECGMYKSHNAGTRMPIMSIVAPKNETREYAIGNALTASLGVIPSSVSWGVRRARFPAEVAHLGVEQIIVDDAHDLSKAHLLYLKELTDTLLAPPHERKVSLCFIVAGGAHTMPLRELFTLPDINWVQFYRRLDKDRRFCHVHGHTENEVGELCVGFEELYRPQFPDLTLRRWTTSIYAWLTHPLLDTDGTKRVTMDNMNTLIVLALRTAHAQGETNVTGETLRAAATLMTLDHDTVSMVDGEPSDIDLTPTDIDATPTDIDHGPDNPPSDGAPPAPEEDVA